MRKGAVLGLLVLLGASVMGAAGQTFYVDAANTGGVENGSASFPYNTIQEGVNAAGTGATVQVAAGTYTERVNITNRSSLTVQGAAGAIVKHATDYKFYIDKTRDVTIRGFDINGGAVAINVDASTNLLLDALKIQSLNSSSWMLPFRCTTSKLTVQNSLIQSNFNNYGSIGGWFNNCSVEYVNNQVLKCEGGNAFVVYGGVYISNGDPDTYTVSIRNNVFNDVKAVYGGAMAIYNKGSIEVKRNVFIECGPWYRSDALSAYGYDQGGMLDIYVWANSTNQIVNNVFRNPRYHYYGSFQGIHILNGSPTSGSLTIRNNIFQNDAPYTNYAGTVAHAIYNASTLAPVVDYNLVSGMSYYNVTAGTGSLDANPLFVSPTNNDVHLASGSPAINAGHPDAIYNDPDASRNDMGAYGGPSGSGGGSGGGGGNTAPVANGQNVSTSEDTSLGITLTATDAETNALTYTVRSGPSHGSLAGSPPSLTYFPAPNYFGPDSFTFSASDASLTSNVATVSITVNAVNDAPVANNQGVTTTQNVAKAIALTASDIDNGSLTYSIAVSPANGALSGTPPNVTYTPNFNFVGSDSFRFRAYDGALFSNTGTVSITVVAQSAGTVYVNAANTSGVENGSASFPYNTIQEGVNGAASGAVVQVAAGLYNETVTLQSRRYLTIRGAGASTVVTNANDKIKIIDSQAITVDAMTLRGGARAGVYISQSTNVLVKNTTIENIDRNPYATGTGGGFEAYYSTIVVASNTIRNITQVSQRGGGQIGGAGYFYDCSLDFCANNVTNCYAWSRAGGLYALGGSTSRVLRIIRNNFNLCYADYSGAIDAQGTFSAMTIENNTIVRSGAGCHQSAGWGGAVRVQPSSAAFPVRLINNVVTDTLYPGCSGNQRVAFNVATTGNVYIANNIMTAINGYAVHSYYPNAGVTAEYNDAYAVTYFNVTAGAGSILASPLFMNPGTNDYRLQATSPCINTGNPAAQYNDLNATRNDMGRFGGPNGY